MSVTIKIYTILEQKEKVKEEIREIFFLTSARKEFDSAEAKEAFWNKWTAYYFNQRPGFLYVAFGKEEQVLGYLTIEPDSLGAAPHFKEHAHYLLFEDFYADFPAHLHINCHPDTQGKGVGSALIKRACEDLKNLGVKGIHLITAPTARNVDFYRKNGFSTERTRTFNAINFLFMGKKL